MPNKHVSTFCAAQRWNEDMAGLAQEWADRCEYKHGFLDFDPAIIGYDALGQNLYVTTFPDSGVKDAVNSWFEEKKDYNYDGRACAHGKICGHYTQVSVGKLSVVGYATRPT